MIAKFYIFLWGLFLLSLPFQFGKHFWFTFSHINGLRVDYLSPAIYLQDILFLLIVLFSFSRSCHPDPPTGGEGSLRKLLNMSFRRPACRQAGKSESIKIAVILVSVVINIFSSFSPFLTLYSFFRLFQFILLIKLAQQEKEKIIMLLKYVLPISAISQLALSVYQIVNGHSVGGLLYWLGERSFTIATPDIAKAFIFNHVWLRPYGTFSHPNSLTGFMLLVFVLAILFLSGRVKWFTLIASSLVVFLSFSQSAWLALFTICSYLLLSIRRISPRGIFISLLGYISLILFVIYLFRGYFIDSPSFVLRLSLLKASWYIFLSHPIFGVGLGNFIIALGHQNEFSRLIHWYQPVHNIFILWLVETGLAGVGIIMFLCYSVYNVPPRRPPRCTPGGRLIELIIPFIITILITGSLDHYWLTLIQNRLLLAVALGLLISCYDKNVVSLSINQKNSGYRKRNEVVKSGEHEKN